MKALILGKLAMMAMVMVVAAAQALAQKIEPQASAPRRVIVVSLEDRKLALVEDGQVKKI